MPENLTNPMQSALAAPAAADTLNIENSVPWGTQPYSTKRHGHSITSCESEPIRAPGCIQSHGALLALRASDLSVLQAPCVRLIVG